MDYEVDMFEKKHPDFFGAIFAKDPQRDDVVHVASEK